MMQAVLVTLAQAKWQLVVENDTTERDSEILSKMETASVAISGYLKGRFDPNWTAFTVPADVREAVLLVLSSIWVNRGDPNAPDPISPAVVSLLMRRRDPALA